jgi:hypothetical protein
VSQVTGVLLNEVKQDAFQRRRVFVPPARARLARSREIGGLDDGSRSPGLGMQRRHQLLAGLLGPDIPATVAAVAERIGDLAAFEAPFDPPQFDEGQVLDELERGPARGQAAMAQFALGQSLDLHDNA